MTTSAGRSFTIEDLLGLTDNGNAVDLCDTINRGPASVYALWDELGKIWADETLDGTVPEPPDALDIADALAADHSLVPVGTDGPGWTRYMPPRP